MVVNHLDDHDGRDLAFIDAASGELRHRIVVRSEDEPRGAPKVEGILPATIASEFMESPRRAAHIGQRWSGSKNAKPPSKDRPLVGAEASGTGAIRFASSGEFPIEPRNVDLGLPLTS
jgi:hypothetical protein